MITFSYVRIATLSRTNNNFYRHWSAPQQLKISQFYDWYFQIQSLVAKLLDVFYGVLAPKNWFLKRINSVPGQAWCNQFCKVCPIGHICITPVIINCSCLTVFTKAFGAQPLRPKNKHQLENSLALTCIASVPPWGVIQPWPGSVSQAGHTQVQ